MIRFIKATFVIALAAALGQAAIVKGKVSARGTTGAAIAGAKVVLITNRGPQDSTTTNAQGEYSFDSVSVGFRTLAASATDYQPATANVSVAEAGGTYTVNITLAPSAATAGIIAGTVKDDSTKEAIANATVVLARYIRGELTPVDTTKTDGEGRFTFAKIPAVNNYAVTATAAGYLQASNPNVDVTAGDTAKVALTMKKEPVPSASISGKVTDATSKAGIGGAKVVLRKRVGGLGGTWVPQDSTLTSGDGSFQFTKLPAAGQTAPYSLVASKDDYVTAASGPLLLGQGESDTVNIVLAKVAKGSMSIYVGLDSAGNPPLSGATVVAALDGASDQSYTGTTNDKGWATFPSVVSGGYSVSAGKDGFVSKVAVRAVGAEEKDTGYVYLARATAQNSKSLSGLVRDAEGKAIEGAKVIFEAANARGVTVQTTTSATGDYAFTGIPVTVTSGTVTVMKEGYGAFESAVTLTGPASYLNVSLIKTVSIAAAPSLHGMRWTGGAAGWTLELPASAALGTLVLVDHAGRRVWKAAVPPGAARVALPSMAAGRIAILFRDGKVLRMSVPSVR